MFLCSAAPDYVRAVAGRINFANVLPVGAERKEKIHEIRHFRLADLGALSAVFAALTTMPCTGGDQGLSGSVKVMVKPFGGSTDGVTVTVPPCSSATAATSANPKPCPGVERLASSR